ncbi:hypothetical protein ACFLR7_06875 [Acidobacteriota bacterium]
MRSLDVNIRVMADPVVTQCVHRDEQDIEILLFGRRGQAQGKTQQHYCRKLQDLHN